MCHMLHNVLFLALGAVRFLNGRENTKKIMCKKQIHKQACMQMHDALALHPPSTLHRFEIALQYLVDVTAHKMTATYPKARENCFCAEKAI